LGYSFASWLLTKDYTLMKTILKALGIITTIFTFLAVISFNSYPTAGKSVIIDGASVFLNNCAVCHGADRSGHYPAIPSLINVGEKLGKENVLAILEKGRNGMPAFTHLSTLEREAVSMYLMEGNSALNTDMLANYEDNGEHLFFANCATCHKVTPEDERPKGQLSSGMKPAVLGGVISRYSFNNFSMLLDKGPCYMPSFAGMKTNQKEAIFKYLMENSFQSNQNQRMSRGMMGRSCRSMMN
jgi:mono/diheme cytochrome c family protein